MVRGRRGMASMDETEAFALLRGVLLELGKSTTTYTQYEYTGYCPGSKYFIRRYGNWQNTLNELIKRYPNFTNELKDASLKRKPLIRRTSNILVGYSDAALIALLKKVVTKENNESQYYDTYRNTDYPSSRSIIFRLGNWNKLMIEIGLRSKPNAISTKKKALPMGKYAKDCTDEELLEMVYSILKDSEINTRDYYDLKRESYMYHSATIVKRFGSWNKTLEKMGLTLKSPHEKTEYSVLSDAEFLDLIKAELLRLDVTNVKQYEVRRNKKETPNLAVIEKRGYTWDEVLYKTGLKVNYDLLTDEELFDLIRENILEKSDGLINGYIYNNYEPSFYYLMNRFGSWRKIIKSLGKSNNPFWSDYSKKELYKVIRDFVVENDIKNVKTYTELARGNPKVPGGSTVTMRFGSLSDVIRDKEGLNLED